MNKSIALHVRTLIDRNLPRLAHNTVHGATKLAKFQKQVNTSKGKLLMCIAKGLILVKAGKVNLFPNWEQHGSAFVTSEDKKQCGHDLDYALNAASVIFLEHLKTRAAKTVHDVVSQYLPVPAPVEGVYIVNISPLTICTCISFIHKGRPYFCKHLHAVLATTNKCHDRLKLWELYFVIVSKIPPGLSTIFTICNTRSRGNIFSGRQSVLQRYHQATKLEEQRFKKCKLLKL